MTAAISQTSENRQAERIHLALPIQIGTETAETRDISPSGVYLETSTSFEVGSEVDFSIELRHVRIDGAVRLICKGRIVRVERHDSRLGVAVTIDSHRFQTVTPQPCGTGQR